MSMRLFSDLRNWDRNSNSVHNSLMEMRGTRIQDKSLAASKT